MTKEQFRDCLAEAREVAYRCLLRIRPHSRDLAEDLAQQVTLELLRQAPEKFATPACVRRYARTAIRNREIDHWRSSKRLNDAPKERHVCALEEPESRDDSPLLTAKRRERARAVQQAVQRLPAKQREVMFCWLNGAETDREAADMLLGDGDQATDAQRQKAARARRDACEALQRELQATWDEWCKT